MKARVRLIALLMVLVMMLPLVVACNDPVVENNPAQDKAPVKGELATLPKVVEKLDLKEVLLEKLKEQGINTGSAKIKAKFKGTMSVPLLGPDASYNTKDIPGAEAGWVECEAEDIGYLLASMTGSDLTALVKEVLAEMALGGEYDDLESIFSALEEGLDFSSFGAEYGSVEKYLAITLCVQALKGVSGADNDSVLALESHLRRLVSGNASLEDVVDAIVENQMLISANSDYEFAMMYALEGFAYGIDAYKQAWDGEGNYNLKVYYNALVPVIEPMYYAFAGSNAFADVEGSGIYPFAEIAIDALLKYLGDDNGPIANGDLAGAILSFYAAGLAEKYAINVAMEMSYPSYTRYFNLADNKWYFSVADGSVALPDDETADYVVVYNGGYTFDGAVGNYSTYDDAVMARDAEAEGKVIYIECYVTDGDYEIDFAEYYDEFFALFTATSERIAAQEEASADVITLAAVYALTYYPKEYYTPSLIVRYGNVLAEAFAETYMMSVIGGFVAKEETQAAFENIADIINIPEAEVDAFVERWVKVVEPTGDEPVVFESVLFDVIYMILDDEVVAERLCYELGIIFDDPQNPYPLPQTFAGDLVSVIEMIEMGMPINELPDTVAFVVYGKFCESFSEEITALYGNMPEPLAYSLGVAIMSEYVYGMSLQSVTVEQLGSFMLAMIMDISAFSTDNVNMLFDMKDASKFVEYMTLTLAISEISMSRAEAYAEKYSADAYDRYSLYVGSVMSIVDEIYLAGDSFAPNDGEDFVEMVKNLYMYLFDTDLPIGYDGEWLPISHPHKELFGEMVDTAVQLYADSQSKTVSELALGEVFGVVVMFLCEPEVYNLTVGTDDVKFSPFEYLIYMADVGMPVSDIKIIGALVSDIVPDAFEGFGGILSCDAEEISELFTVVGNILKEKSAPDSPVWCAGVNLLAICDDIADLTEELDANTLCSMLLEQFYGSENQYAQAIIAALGANGADPDDFMTANLKLILGLISDSENDFTGIADVIMALKNQDEEALIAALEALDTEASASILAVLVATVDSGTAIGQLIEAYMLYLFTGEALDMDEIVLGFDDVKVVFIQYVEKIKAEQQISWEQLIVDYLVASAFYPDEVLEDAEESDDATEYLLTYFVAVKAFYEAMYEIDDDSFDNACAYAATLLSVVNDPENITDDAAGLLGIAMFYKEQYAFEVNNFGEGIPSTKALWYAFEIIQASAHLKGEGNPNWTSVLSFIPVFAKDIFRIENLDIQNYPALAKLLRDSSEAVVCNVSSDVVPYDNALETVYFFTLDISIVCEGVFVGNCSIEIEITEPKV